MNALKRSVTRWALFLSVFGNLLNFFYGAQYRTQFESAPILSTFILILSFSFLYFISSKILQRKNWARLIYVVMITIGTVNTVFMVPTFAALNGAVLTFAVIQFCLQYYAAYLLTFDKNTKPLFKAPSPENTGGSNYDQQNSPTNLAA